MPNRQAASVENMFSITCAQKMAKIKTLPSELEAWEQRRKAESSKIQERLRRERSSKAVFPRGYGPTDRVPKHVEAHIGLLEESPLARPVFSPGRCIQRSACGRRPQSAAATTGTRYHAKPTRAAVNTRPKTAHDRRLTEEQWQSQGKRAPSASSPLLFDQPAHRSSAVSRSTLEAGGRARPATAPCVSSRRQRYYVEEAKHIDGAREEEARLVQKMARLSGVQRGGQFPTVAALKTAVALKALQAQLRECRASNSLRTNPTPVARVGDDGDNQKRAASAPASRSPAAAGDGNPAAPRGRGTSARRRSRRGREQQCQHELKPWDNHSPFIPESSASPSRSVRVPGSPTSPAAPLVRTLTRDDPVFGCGKARSSRPPLPPPESPAIPKGEQHSHNGEDEAESSPSAAPVAQEAHIQTCFRRLTVDTLVELSHLRNPPKPVLAVLAGLGCLLGWKQDTKGLRPSPKRASRLKQPPRSLFSNVYALRDALASVRPTKITSRRLSAIVTRLCVPEAAPAKVRSANAAAWVLLEWLLSVVDCARAAGGSSGGV